MAPVGWYISACKTRPEWYTRSAHGPSYAWCTPDQVRHASTVPSRPLAISSGVQGAGASLSNDVRFCRANPAASPSRRVNDIRAVEPSIAWARSVESSDRSAPPRDSTPSSVPVRSGVTRPNSGRGANSTSTSTAPSVHSIRRSSVRGAPAPRSWPCSVGSSAIASVSTATPPPVRNVVSSTMVRSRYPRVAVNSPFGVTEKWPAESSRIRANTAGLSNRGRHSQSTEPALLTSAAE